MKIPDNITTIPEPKNIQTRKLGGGKRYIYHELVARQGETYIFLDNVFFSENMNGAVGSRMCPISKNEWDRRKEEFFDYEWSPVGHIYDEQTDYGNDKSWDEWVENVWRTDGPDLLYDPSYESRYGPIVEERVSDEFGYEPYVVECVGGGRMFTRETEYDEVYRPDLLTFIKQVEASNE